jgi:hypothetical protein
MGGLGNQMFQIAKALSESFNHNLPCFFKSHSFIPMEGRQPTNYKNNIFRNIIFDDTKIPSKRVSEPTWAYHNIKHLFTEPTEFYGYFQSSKNFLSYGEEIKKTFLPTDNFIEKIGRLYPDVFKKNSVSIHVRRGDYIGVSNILPVIDKTYIDECINRIGDYTKIFIFSNDKEWVKNNLSYQTSTVVEGLEDYEELWMMSLCNHNVMSNSSFSWWGSYLNLNNNKNVFVPSIWFGPHGESNYQDVYEDDWIKINTIFDDGKIKIKK